MRPRIIGRIVIAILIILFTAGAVIGALEADEESLYHGIEGLVSAVLALTMAVCYRYFED
jgi:hypothetical protein